MGLGTLTTRSGGLRNSQRNSQCINNQQNLLPSTQEHLLSPPNHQASFPEVALLPLTTRKSSPTSALSAKSPARRSKLLRKRLMSLLLKNSLRLTKVNPPNFSTCPSLESLTLNRWLSFTRITQSTVVKRTSDHSSLVSELMLRPTRLLTSLTPKRRQSKLNSTTTNHLKKKLALVPQVVLVVVRRKLWSKQRLTRKR